MDTFMRIMELITMEWACNSDEEAKKGVQNSDGRISWEIAACKTRTHITHVGEHS
jgi:hypothetical protein